jgi:hypothetical protein
MADPLFAAVTEVPRSLNAADAASSCDLSTVKLVILAVPSRLVRPDYSRAEVHPPNILRVVAGAGRVTCQTVDIEKPRYEVAAC